MQPIRLLVALVIVGVVGLAIAPAVSAGPQTGGHTAANATESGSNTTVATFMQTSAAETEQTVESGMFEAAFENASNESQAEMVADRTAAFEDRLERLEQDYDELNESGPTYEPRSAKLMAEISSLERAINATKPRAAEAGVSSDRLSQLHANTSTLAGSEVAAIAQERGGGPPVGTHSQNQTPAQNQTPPGDTGADDTADGAGSGDEKPPADRPEPTEGMPGSSANGDDTSPGAEPDTVGSEDASNGAGPPEAGTSGSASDSGPAATTPER
ncbi:hypothetical protein D8Y22_01415 [Salinadaptatus halalkaliphilus]|uniref:Uncharacterized protein n=1 Tax=Salinadaptatus halalkaliphilus TaxID=2419781 RepID=A0A4S3TR55_9EURY|nr:hypothetical protein [Salinadaptatus halalkaliphilus]THE66806.1 hypothetical protein D8Y22_01415 [Salinadaptatus halalkaliphilus]